ncbi:PilZ domain-containing protein [Photobacterium sanguinicancri]|uniref:Flagellar brake domain-containing protein n=1 Tax=Photobacterium sanguinicancri TaxID=875932 RepID=A0AAW7Y5S0_9GAMM|nr:PilZ domain-containing protein [Photobacterium sanguinicancri]KXI23508.1 hypothetical protein AS132_06660 [Photobacterium sanguinicancri]MDO6543968.1 flagellar brake domain-containing protein [Photobacterium sanguinicancri]
MSNKDREKLIPGAQGALLIKNSSIVTISIKTPLGRIFRCETVFIGTDSHDYLLLEMPSIPKKDIDMYLLEGFNISIKAISDRGEGAIIRFASRIEHLIFKPIGLLAISLPHSMMSTPLRSEPRFEVTLQGKVILSERQLLVELQNLSHKGCCFQHSIHGPEINLDQKVDIFITNPTLKTYFQLSGSIKSINRVGVFCQYGVMFDPQGCSNTKLLLKQLVFDGVGLSFKK